MTEDQFFELTIKVLSNEANADEKQLLDELLTINKYKRLYNWLNKEWSRSNTTRFVGFNFERSLSRLRNKIDEKERFVAIQQKAKKRRNRFIQIAASFILLFGISGAGFLFLKKTDVAAEQIEQQITFSTSKGERDSITLPDGSLAILNSKSTISFPKKFAGNTRSVSLTGEAFFQVTKNKEKPFIVKSGKFSTTVLGTSFNVLSDGSEIAVTVETGIVKVEREGISKDVTLTRGMQTVYKSTAPFFYVNNVAPANYTDWRKNIMHFNAMSLQKAMSVMEDWYNVTIVNKLDKSLQNRKIRGAYNDEDLASVLDDLQFLIDFKYEFKNDSTIIMY